MGAFFYRDICGTMVCMTSEMEKYAPIILEEVKKANHILLHCHPSPDPDSVGSTLAMYQVLKSMGKEVTAIRGDSHTPVAFAAIPGFENIIHKSYFEVDLSQFDLFIIQDSGSLGQISKYEPVVFPPTMKTVVIDHHSSNTGFAAINLIDPTYPAVCQMLYDIFNLWKVEITHPIALCLLAGIFSDTGGFRFATTQVETFLAAAELVKIAPDYSAMIFQIMNSRNPKELQFWGLALSSIHTYFGDSVAIAQVSNEALVKAGIGEGDIPEPISWMLQSVFGWNIAITATEKRAGIISFSFRSRDEKKYDVSKIASVIGGGGHKAASGASLKVPFPEAIDAVLKAVAQVYPELGKA
jgi:phosphoesterase RecJ-like protein